MTALTLIAIAWALAALVMVALFVLLDRRPLTDVDRHCAAVDRDLDERAAIAELYGGPRHIDVSPIDPPIDPGAC
jgi:hypothetical protein